jgi:hypothetical protein
MRSRKLRKVIGFYNQDGAGSVHTLDQEVCVSAARAVLKESNGPEDAALLLDMLGLIPPIQPVVTRAQASAAQRTEHDKRKRARIKAEKKAAKESK